MKRSVLNTLLAVAGVAVLGLATSCRFNCVHGSGHSSTETRTVTEAFTKLEISGGYKVILKQDSTNKITITADDNILKYIKTKNDDGTLKIFTHKNICDGGDMTVTIGVKNLDEIRASGATELSADGKLVCKDIAFHLSGMSKIDLDLNAANVSVESSGTGELNLRGQASTNHVETSGMIQLHAFDFVVSDYEITTSGASHCEVNVLHSLHVSTSGASEIKYKGTPTDVTNDKSGASSLDKVE
jgi:hypothetical protein